MSGQHGRSIRRIAGFGLTTQNADRLAAFYIETLGARYVATKQLLDTDFLNGKGRVKCVKLVLGNALIELLEFDQPGAPYPLDANSSDLSFQHFAIAVTDMERACMALSCAHGWTAISTHGPQVLPKSSGGVSAFKFRDPDGHPLELLCFPRGEEPAAWKGATSEDLFLGIDHSAISVADSQRSIAFYQALGFGLASQGFNQGLEQQRLDGLADARVDVIALSAAVATPHLELLCYRQPLRRSQPSTHSNDVAATRLFFEADVACDSTDTVERCLVDPDGHHIVIVSSAVRDATRGGATEILFDTR